MGKIREYLLNDHIQISFGTGAGIIILALFFKKVMHIPVPYLEASLPAFVILAYEGLREKKRLTKEPWTRPWLWNLLQLLVVVLVMLRRLIMD